MAEILYQGEFLKQSESKKDLKKTGGIEFVSMRIHPQKREQKPIRN